MSRESHFRHKLPHRGRGLDALDRHVGGILAEIDSRLEARDVVRVLELGCGYGTALLELRARYGRRVDLHGVNRFRGDGNPEILARNATERGIATTEVELPAIAYADVAHGLPFPDDAFDLVYSQVAWLYFGNKIGVLQEVIRVLDVAGVAKIDADEIRDGLPAEYARLVEIWDAGRLVTLGEYLGRFDLTLETALEGEYMRLRKVHGFGADLAPVLEIDLSELHADWDGIKCVYRRLHA